MPTTTEDEVADRSHVAPCRFRARLNCISHLLSIIPYEDIVPDPVQIPEREDLPCIRPPVVDQTFVEQLY